MKRKKRGNYCRPSLFSLQTGLLAAGEFVASLSALARIQLNASTLSENIGLQGDHIRIIRGQLFTFQRVTDTPVDHFPQCSNAPQLYLELGVSFRVGVGGIRVTLATGYAIGTEFWTRPKFTSLVGNGFVLCLPG